MGFDLIMRMQAVITIVTGVLTVVYIILVARQDPLDCRVVDPRRARSTEAHRRPGVHDDRVRARLGQRGRRLLALPAAALLGPGVVGWTTFGSSIAPVFLLIFGLLLAGSSSSADHRDRHRPDRGAGQPAADLVPRPVRDRRGARPGRRRGAGHLLVRAGAADARRAGAPVTSAALIDGTVMTLGAIYVVFIAQQLLRPVRGLPDHARACRSPPGAASCWPTSPCAAAITPSMTCSTPAAATATSGWFPVGVIVVGTVIGWGLVTNSSAGWLNWQGYLLGPFGLGGKTGAWAFANLGVLAALVHRLRRHAGVRPRGRSGRRKRRRWSPPSRAMTGQAGVNRRSRRRPRGHRHAAGVRRTGQPLARAAVRARSWRRSAGWPRRSRPRVDLHQVRGPGRARTVPGGGTTTSGRSRSSHRTRGSTSSPTSSPRGRRPRWTPPPSASGRPNWRPGAGQGPLLLAGVSTDCCVLSTALAAADAGVTVRVVADACAGIDDESHAKALAHHGPLRPAGGGGHRGRRPRRGEPRLSAMDDTKAACPRGAVRAGDRGCAGHAHSVAAPRRDRGQVRRRWSATSTRGRPDHPLAAGLPAGTVTDDTEQAVLLARLVVAGGGLDRRRPRWHATCSAWEESMRARGSLDLLGPSTRQALAALAAGAHGGPGRPARRHQRRGHADRPGRHRHLLPRPAAAGGPRGRRQPG